MRKSIFFTLLTSLVVFMILSACKKDDTGDGTVPEIVLLGFNPAYWAKDVPYEDAGVIAFDVTPAGDTIDLTASIVVTDNVDVANIGEYNVVYNVTDESGVSAEEKVRVVKVVAGK